LPAFDADARAYIRASGATARAEINHFVKAIKRLGLWNALVCWPLRSAQNAGAGSTAYSLGGLGTFNGTLVNGPTWGPEGVTFQVANYIDVRFGSSRRPASATVGVVTKSNNSQPGFSYCGSISTNSIGAESLSILSFGSSGSNFLAEGYISSSGVKTNPISNTSGIFRWSQAEKTSSNIISRLNNSTQSAVMAGGITYDRLISTGRWQNGSLQNDAGAFGVGYEGVHSFMFLTEGVSDFYLANIYKQTLGQGLGLPIIYDADAAAYAQASGATDIDNINAFVVGVKSLGLWDSMVCWPLRSSQNAGTGLTAYSLGGLGTFNGTLVNGPTWGPDGVVFNSNSSSRVQTSLMRSSTPLTLTMVANFSGKNGGGVDDWSNGFGFAANGAPNLGANADGTAFGVNRIYVSDGFTVPITTGSYFFQSATMTSTTIDNYLNGLTNQGSLSVTPWANGPLVFGGHTSQYFNGKVSFGMFTDTLLSSSTKALLSSLYKQTLGQGLGLP
jgi:hypothetical protein